MPPKDARRTKWIVIIGVPLMVLVLLFIIRPGPNADRPECPLVSVDVRHSESKAPLKLKALTISRDQTTVPEFNDCQRFPEPGDLSNYGPLVGIFASATLVSDMQAIVDLASQNNPLRAIAVAQIVDWGGIGKGDYDPLNISRNKFGFNCLYMWVTAPGSFHAAVTWVEDERMCVDKRDFTMIPPDSTLEVLRLQAPPSPLADYPPVARWDWDATRKQQFIGIACLDGWCEIAKKGHVTSPSYASASSSKQFKIKGYYDEEFLAVMDPNGKLVVSPVVGTVMPSPELATLNESIRSFQPVGGSAPWPVVAYSSLSGPVPSYKTKLNYDVGDVMGGRFNMVALCAGSRADCGVPKTVKECAPGTKDPWWAKVTTASGNISYRCVIRRTHPGMIIPDIVRWRWLDTDQIGWIKCPEGCCELTGEP